MLCNRDIEIPQAWNFAWVLFEQDQKLRGRSTRSMSNRRSVVNCMARCFVGEGVSDPAGVTKTMLKAYLGAQLAARSGTGIDTLFNDLRVWWRWHAHETDETLAECDGERCAHLGKMAGVQRPKLPPQPKVPVYTPEELAAIGKVIKGKDLWSLRSAALVWLLMQTGIRHGELAGLTVEDFDLKTHKITIRADTAKLGKERPVRAGDEAYAALIRWLSRAKLTSGPMFVRLTRGGPGQPWTATGHRLTYAGITHVLHVIGERAGVADCRAHRFRHTTTDLLLKAGMEAVDVATLLGHENLTQIFKTYGASMKQERALAAAQKFQVGGALNGK